VRGDPVPRVSLCFRQFVACRGMRHPVLRLPDPQRALDLLHLGDQFTAQPAGVLYVAVEVPLRLPHGVAATLRLPRERMQQPETALSQRLINGTEPILLAQCRNHRMPPRDTLGRRDLRRRLRPIRYRRLNPIAVMARTPTEVGSTVGCHRKAGVTSLMNSSRDLRFSWCGRLLSHQKLNSSTPSS
jgi:hypothetical protein